MKNLNMIPRKVYSVMKKETKVIEDMIMGRGNFRIITVNEFRLDEEISLESFGRNYGEYESKNVDCTSSATPSDIGTIREVVLGSHRALVDVNKTIVITTSFIYDGESHDLLGTFSVVSDLKETNSVKRYYNSTVVLSEKRVKEIEDRGKVISAKTKV